MLLGPQVYGGEPSGIRSCAVLASGRAFGSGSHTLAHALDHLITNRELLYLFGNSRSTLGNRNVHRTQI